MKQYQTFNGEYFGLDEKSGYWQNTKTRERMHRYVWKHYYGDIPKGFHIHHLDGDKSNNDISNLAMVSPKAHANIHKETRSQETWDKLRENCDRIRPLTKAWHASEEGHNWHKEHYENTKDKLHAEREFVCENCGKPFTAVGNGLNRFCCNACKSAWRRKSGVDDIELTCPVCGKVFKTNKYSGNKTCSRECGRKARWSKI